MENEKFENLKNTPERVCAPEFSWAASPEIKEAAMRLWKTVFGDSDEYIRLILNSYFRPGRSLFAAAPGSSRAAESLGSFLMTIPYDFSLSVESRLMLEALNKALWRFPAGDESAGVLNAFKSKLLDGGGGKFLFPLRGLYLCGLSTRIDLRGRGTVSRMIEEALLRARQEQFDFCFLLPASDSLREFYSRRGFVSMGGLSAAVENSIHSIELTDYFSEKAGFENLLKNLNYSVPCDDILFLCINTAKCISLLEKFLKKVENDAGSNECLNTSVSGFNLSELNSFADESGGEVWPNVELFRNLVLNAYSLFVESEISARNSLSIRHSLKDFIVVLIENAISGGRVFVSFKLKKAGHDSAPSSDSLFEPFALLFSCTGSVDESRLKLFVCSPSASLDALKAALKSRLTTDFALSFRDYAMARPCVSFENSLFNSLAPLCGDFQSGVSADCHAEKALRALSEELFALLKGSPDFLKVGYLLD